MKPKGLTIVETLVVALIASAFMGIIFSVLMVGRNTWIKNAAYIDLQEKTRYTIDKIARELSQSRLGADYGDVQIISCSTPPTGYTCINNYIKFKVPISNTTSDIVGSIYKSDGTIKWGTKDREGWYTTYLVSNSDPNKNRLLHIVPTDPTGACCKSGYCQERTQASCTSWGGQYRGNGVSCGSITCPTGTCFVSGTPILMADGSTRPIENVKVGDKILAFDEKTKTLKEDSVKLFFQHDGQEYLVVNDSLKVTPNHPVYSEGKWVEIGKLPIGSKLLNSQGQAEEITSIRLVREPVKVYNLEVNPYHTYIAGGVVVHNKTTPIEPGPIGIPDCPDCGNPLSYNLRNFFKKLFDEALLFADEVGIMASNITYINFENTPGTRNIVITVTAQGKTMMGETVEVTLKSTVYLRN